MITNKKLLVLLTAASLTPAIRADFFDWDMDSFWDKQIKFMEDMRDTMNKTQQAMKSAFDNKNTISLSFTEDEKDNVVITLKGIKTDTFDASINSDKDILSISTPTENIKVYVDHLSRDREFISVEVAQEIRKEQTRDAQKNEKEQKQTFYSSSRIRSGHTIEGSINFDAILDNPAQVITYNKKEETLTILLPKTVAKKSGHAIPVAIVSEEEK